MSEPNVTVSLDAEDAAPATIADVRRIVRAEVAAALAEMTRKLRMRQSRAS